MDRYLTQSEFARRIGCSRQTVSKALKNGRIVYCEDKVDESGRKLIDWETQSVSFNANTNALYIRTTKLSEQVNKTPKFKVKKEIKDVNDPPKKVEKKTKKAPKKAKKVPKKEPPKPKFISLKEFMGEDVKDIKDVGEVGLEEERMPIDPTNRKELLKNIEPPKGTFAYNQNRKMAIEADRHELKYAGELGEVMPTEMAIAIAGAKMVTVKESIMAMPSRVVGLIDAIVRTKVKEFHPDAESTMYVEILNALNKAVDDVLVTLAANQEKLPESIGEYFDDK